MQKQALLTLSLRRESLSGRVQTTNSKVNPSISDPRPLSTHSNPSLQSARETWRAQVAPRHYPSSSMAISSISTVEAWKRRVFLWHETELDNVLSLTASSDRGRGCPRSPKLGPSRARCSKRCQGRSENKAVSEAKRGGSIRATSNNGQTFRVDWSVGEGCARELLAQRASHTHR